jgi:F-type H+-transporting ATPase subunit b
VSFDLTTFVLEVLNFLVLVWLLQRFFYRPVLAVIERRRADGAAILASAQALRDEAEGLKDRYEASIARAAEERSRAMAELEGDVAVERGRRLAGIDAELAAERERRQSLEARERGERDAAREREALALAARFVSRLLERVASPALEDKLVELAEADLQTMAPEQRASLQAAFSKPGARVQITTAYPLAPARRSALATGLGALAGTGPTVQFLEDTTLKAGLRIVAGPWLLSANLGEELEFFRTSVDHAD